MTYQTVPNPGAGLRLHLNENTAGCSPAVLEAIRSIDREDTAFYPDYGPITTAAEHWFGVPAGWVQLTNGLDEGLHVAAQMAARAARAAAPTTGDTGGGRGGSDLAASRGNRQATGQAVIVEPAFEMYAACAEAAELETVHIPPQPDFRFPTDLLMAATDADTRLVNLTDPNNPTGLPIPAGVIERIARAAPQAMVLVDEAYAEFSGRTSIGPVLDRHRNVIVGRTFAKAHGLAALRIGALVAHPDTLAPIRRLLPPYSLNICAVRALGAALDDRAYLEWYVAQSVESRELIATFCRKYGFTFWPSEANFVLIRIGARAGDVVRALAGRRIFIRDRSEAPGCAGCIRITAGVVDHTRECLNALEDILAARTH